MTAPISLYTFEDSYSTQDYAEAIEYARRYERAIIANEYEWADSEIIADYRPTSAEEPE